MNDTERKAWAKRLHDEGMADPQQREFMLAAKAIKSDKDRWDESPVRTFAVQLQLAVIHTVERLGCASCSEKLREELYKTEPGLRDVLK